MSKLRKASKALEKPNLVKPKNDAYQIEKRSYAPKHNKAIYHIDFSKCTDPHIRLSIEGRTLSITNEKQRQWLIDVSKLIKPGESLIPVDRTYKQHLSHYQTQTKAMGVSKLHDLRHAYAQRRYHKLTQALDPKKQGLTCPLAGGVNSKDLKGLEKDLDRSARMILTRELGHSRSAIVRIYCG